MRAAGTAMISSGRALIRGWVWPVSYTHLVLLPKLQAAGVGVSSLGTAIGKVEVDDEEGFAKQLEQLETLCENAKLCLLYTSAMASSS